jgi:NitT/TauT family transport system ATP-binding protein
MNPKAVIIPLVRRPRSTEAILTIEKLGRVFPVGASFLMALKGVDFRVARGELICILGRSGCGKSTLLKVVAGFMEPTTGVVRLNGKAVTGPGPDRCVVFQEDTLFPWLTVRENVAFGMKGKGFKRKDREEEVDKYLSLVGLSDFGDYLPREISGGMKQRVALARVLILEPQVLLMDEPFASLDAQTREEMQNLLLSLWAQLGHTILFVTHDVQEAVTLADRVLVMSRSPGSVGDELEVPLPRPRKRDEEAFISCTRALLDALRT